MTITCEIKGESANEYVDADGKPVIEITETWLMKDNTSSRVNIDQARLNFHTTSGIYPGVVHSSNSLARCRRAVPKRNDTLQPHQAWDVQVEYTTDSPLIDDPDPSKRRWKRSVTTSEQTRYIFRDRNDKLIVDAAGTPFDGGVPVVVELQTFVWKHNVDYASYNLGSVAYSGYLNSVAFGDKPPYTCLLHYQADEDYEGKYHFWAETYTIIYDPDGWRPKPANAGLYEIKFTQIFNKRRQRIQVGGKDAIEPEPLYPDGTLIPYDRRPQDCNFITVDYNKTMDFAVLNLPTGPNPS